MKNERYLKYCEKNDLDPNSNVSELLYSYSRLNKLLTVAYIVSAICYVTLLIVDYII